MVGGTYSLSSIRDLLLLMPSWSSSSSISVLDISLSVPPYRVGCVASVVLSRCPTVMVAERVSLDDGALVQITLPAGIFCFFRSVGGFFVEVNLAGVVDEEEGDEDEEEEEDVCLVAGIVEGVGSVDLDIGVVSPFRFLMMPGNLPT